MMLTPAPKPTVDPLEAARQQLDFEAIAQSAPSVKHVLFKAQTMAPIAPAKPWGKIGLAAACAVATLMLLFAPLVPHTAILALVKVQFERQFTQEEAQELVFAVTRDLPDNALLGVTFGKAPGQSAVDSSGKLLLSFTAFNNSPEALAKTSMFILKTVAPESQPFFSATHRVKSQTWHTLPALLGSMLNRKNNGPSYPLSKVGAARDALNMEQLVAFGLAEELEQAGYRLLRFKFMGAASGTLPSGYDFSLPAWPTWIAVDLDGYSSLSDHQQAETRLVTGEYLRSVNLASSSLMLSTSSSSAHPVLITVTLPDGRRDAYLSAKVQAWIEMPQADPPKTVRSLIIDAVGQAVQKVLPGAQAIITCREDLAASAVGSEPRFEATVELTGKHKSIFDDLEQTFLKEEGSQEF